MLFLRDKRGISEEFTSLPALMVVMIGFAIFFALVAGVYHAYNERMEAVDKYEIANFVLEKLTMADGSLCEKGIIMPGGVINISKLSSLTVDDMVDIRASSGIVGVKFGFKLEVSAKYYDGPVEKGIGNGQRSFIAVSREVPVYLNDAQTVPGIFTVMVWKE